MSNITSSSLPTSIPLGVDLSDTVDGIFYGYAISTVLFGVTILQAWIYINTNRDKWPLRMLVAGLVLADFTTTCLDTQIMHHFFIANFGDLAGLTVIPTTLKLELLITVVIVFCVEIFFASRVWLLKTFHWIVPALIVVIALGASGAGIATVIAQFQNPVLAFTLTDRSPRFEIGFDAGLAALADLIATAAMCWSFSNAHVGIRKTDTLLQKLFQYTVTRGIFVTVDQALTLVIILAKPDKLWWMPFHLSLSKVYVITMVAMLNSRESLREQIHGGVITDSEIITATHASGTTLRSNGGGDLAIKPFTVAAIYGNKEQNNNRGNDMELQTYGQKIQTPV